MLKLYLYSIGFYFLGVFSVVLRIAMDYKNGDFRMFDFVMNKPDDNYDNEFSDDHHDGQGVILTILPFLPFLNVLFGVALTITSCEPHLWEKVVTGVLEKSDKSNDENIDKN